MTPDDITELFGACMRHYPSPYELGEAAKKAPHIFGDPR